MAAAVAAHVLPPWRRGACASRCATPSRWPRRPRPTSASARRQVRQGGPASPRDRGRPLRRRPDPVGLRTGHARGVGRRTSPNSGRPARARSRRDCAGRTSSAIGRGRTSWTGSSTTWPGCGVLGFARTLERTASTTEGVRRLGSETTRHWPTQLTDSYFAHRDRDPALFADTVPCLEALRGRATGSACSPTAAGCPRRSAWAASSSRRVRAGPPGGQARQGRSSRSSSVSWASPPRTAACWSATIPRQRRRWVVAAQAPRWPPVWIDRDGRRRLRAAARRSSTRPDAIVRSLGELPRGARRRRAR